MKNFTIVLVAALSLTTLGCKKKGGAGDAMAKMSEFKDKMCACKDKKCADDVQDQMNKWSAENAKNAGDKKAEAPDEKTMKEMQEVGTKYGECMAKAMGGGDTPPPPPAGSDSGSGSAAATPPATGSGTATAGCVDGAWKDPSNTYCVKVPEGYTPPKESKKDAERTWDSFSTEEPEGNFGIKVWTDAAQFESLKKTHMTDGNGSKIVESGAFADGNGWYVKARRDADKETHTSSVLKAGTKVIECEAMATDDKPLKPEDACKTLRAM